MDELAFVTIPKKTYDELLWDQKVLEALRAAGVNNWEGFGDALTPLEEED